jgi:hypothetical protein
VARAAEGSAGKKIAVIADIAVIARDRKSKTLKHGGKEETEDLKVGEQWIV